MLLYDPAIDEVLRAQPSTTTTANGKTIPYPFPSPADWRDHWIYFLLVDRFNNPSRPPSPNTFPCDVYQGGNFAGIQAQLPYLRELGVTALWISPVLLNPQWFHQYWGGYGIMDFLRIEPRFCGDPQAALDDPAVADAEFRALVDEAHAQGIYIILDIVLNHTGDLFNYEGMRDSAPWNHAGTYDVFWRNEAGVPQGNWTDISSVPHLSSLAGIWPQELQRNTYFRRRGDVGGSPDMSQGDFGQLKELATDYQDAQSWRYPVRDILIRAYQYLIAKFDLDGYRIDTLQYVESDFSRVFGNAMREYALSIGKKNFFTFGEVWQDDDEARIAEFIGRNTQKDGQFVGVDAAIDFPIRKRLVSVCKGFEPPSVLVDHYNHRQQVLRNTVSSHGDASRYYVSFLDNHDLDARFHNPAFPGQTRVALACMMSMQGIACVYYGQEQGLSGAGHRREYARQALWGMPNAFDRGSELYMFIKELSIVRGREPALRYGREYFRPCSGNGVDFGFSTVRGGVLCFSRILNNREVLVVANTSTTTISTVDVVVDYNLHDVGSGWELIFPAGVAGAGGASAGQPGAEDTGAVQLGGEVAGAEFAGEAHPSASPGQTALTGQYKSVRVTVRPMDCVIFAPRT